MHRYTDQTAELASAITAYALERIKMDPPPIDGPATLEELQDSAGQTITAEGLGGLEALRVFVDKLAPATISTDQPRNWAISCACATFHAGVSDTAM